MEPEVTRKFPKDPLSPPVRDRPRPFRPTFAPLLTHRRCGSTYLSVDERGPKVPDRKPKVPHVAPLANQKGHRIKHFWLDFRSTFGPRKGPFSGLSRHNRKAFGALSEHFRGTFSPTFSPQGRRGKKGPFRKGTAASHEATRTPPAPCLSVDRKGRSAPLSRPFRSTFAQLMLHFWRHFRSSRRGGMRPFRSGERHPRVDQKGRAVPLRGVRQGREVPFGGFWGDSPPACPPAPRNGRPWGLVGHQPAARRGGRWRSLDDY